LVRVDFSVDLRGLYKFGEVFGLGKRLYCNLRQRCGRLLTKKSADRSIHGEQGYAFLEELVEVRVHFPGGPNQLSDLSLKFVEM
jgi:hypothetical protein